ncbi:rubrerythrin-like domain-containing protein [Salinirubellus sp. GCM10025818]
MTRTDPYTPRERRPYECPRCGYRTTAADGAGSCPDCGTHLADLGVPRE